MGDMHRRDLHSSTWPHSDLPFEIAFFLPHDFAAAFLGEQRCVFRLSGDFSHFFRFPPFFFFERCSRTHELLGLDGLSFLREPSVFLKRHCFSSVLPSSFTFFSLQVSRMP